MRLNRVDYRCKVGNTVKYLLTTNLTEAAALIIAMLIGFPTLFHPIQLLYINLISDGLPAIALAFSPGDKTVMTEKPEEDLYLHGLTKLYVCCWVARFVYCANLVLFVRSSWESVAKPQRSRFLALTQSYFISDIWRSHRSLLRDLDLLTFRTSMAAFLSPFGLQSILLNVSWSISSFSLHVMSFGFFMTMVALSSCATIGIWLFKLAYKPS